MALNNLTFAAFLITVLLITGAVTTVFMTITSLRVWDTSVIIALKLVIGTTLNYTCRWKEIIALSRTKILQVYGYLPDKLIESAIINATNTK